MSSVLATIIPVFLVIFAGYIAVFTKKFSEDGVNGLMRFTQRFAIPCVLFNGISQLEFGDVFGPALLVPFYVGSTSCFFLGILAARHIFKRRPGESVAIGFGALFSNSLLIGLPVMERAYGPDSLAPNFGIIAIHAPFCYLVGITAMEFSRADGRGLGATMSEVIKAMTRNSLTIGIAIGVAVNLSGLTLPTPLQDAIDLIARAGLPAALFGLGGVLATYGIAASVPTASVISVLSLIVHPGIAYLLATQVFHVDDAMLRGIIVTAAMAPGVNTYVFATLYNRAETEAASIVCLGTALSVLTVPVWLMILGGAA
ncbi:AEC family transporter [Paracoccaceae bacterium GXU_MW_L88]